MNINSIDDERVIPGRDPEKYIIEHLAEYWFFLQYCIDRKVLDIGCGVGHGTKMLSGVAKEILGIDYSKPVIDYMDNDMYQLMDAEKELPEGEWDCMVMVQVLEHFHNPKEFVQRARKQIPVGGYLLVGVPLNHPSKFHHTIFSKPEDVEKLFDGFSVQLFGHKKSEDDYKTIYPETSGCAYVLAVAQRNED